MNKKAMQAKAKFEIKLSIRLAKMSALTSPGMNRSWWAVGGPLHGEQERCPLVFCLPAQGSAKCFQGCFMISS